MNILEHGWFWDKILTTFLWEMVAPAPFLAPLLFFLLKDKINLIVCGILWLILLSALLFHLNLLSASILIFFAVPMVHAIYKCFKRFDPLYISGLIYSFTQEIHKFVEELKRKK